MALLDSRAAVLMDGAMGSELLRAGARVDDCLEAWNLTRPATVCAIHRSYVQAGARVLLTNTFQANRGNLARHGLENQLADILRAGVALARACAGNDGLVLGDIGPCELDAIAEILTPLADADGIVLETWSDSGALLAARQCRSQLPATTPLLLSITYRHEPDGQLTTLDGRTPEFFAERAESAGVSALGVNCGRDIDLNDMVEIVRRYRAATNLPLLVRPNAGNPGRAGAGWEYPCTPARMAEQVPALVQAGATLIGGCCGTTPGHIRECSVFLERSE